MDEIKTIMRFPSGVITPPPSKSLSHRAIICAALAALSSGESVLHNIGHSQDIAATMDGMRALGAEFAASGDTLRVTAGRAGTEAAIDCGESGSTLRFLLPIAACLGRGAVFSGRGRLMERPLEIYDDVFAQAGVDFARTDGEIRVQGTMKSGEYRISGSVSSQFVTGLLLALPLLAGDSRIILSSALESADYVTMTIDVMRQFGVAVLQDGDTFCIRGGQQYSATAYTVEPDFSQAAFFLAAAALGRDVQVKELCKNSLQGDREILSILKDMGAEIVAEDDTLTVRADTLKAVTVDARNIPDLIPPVAVLCCFCDGISHIINAGRLRIKESDRLHALKLELRALGADIEEDIDSLTIVGRPALRGGSVQSHNDHRIAMAMAVAAIRCENPVQLSGFESVAKSYPAFWQDFENENTKKEVRL